MRLDDDSPGKQSLAKKTDPRVGPSKREGIVGSHLVSLSACGQGLRGVYPLTPATVRLPSGNRRALTVVMFLVFKPYERLRHEIRPRRFRIGKPLEG